MPSPFSVLGKRGADFMHDVEALEAEDRIERLVAERQRCLTVLAGPASQRDYDVARAELEVVHRQLAAAKRAGPDDEFTGD